MNDYRIYGYVTPAYSDSSLEAPTITSVTGKSTSSIEIKWSKVSGADSYRIDRRITHGDWSTIKKGVTSTSYTDTGLQEATKYCYRVYAVKGSNTSAKQDGVWGTTLKSLTHKDIHSRIDDDSDHAFYYKGSEIKPALYDGDTKLKNGTDYTAEYQNNLNVGTMTVTYTGKGNYTGTKTQTIPIIPVSLSSPGASFQYTLEYNSVVYEEGQTYTPSVGIVYDVFGEHTNYLTLKKDTDFRVSYRNNTAPGTAYIDIEGIGNYTGKTTLSFEIVYQGTEMTSGYDRVLPDGDYIIACAADPSYHLDIKGYDSSAPDNANVQIYYNPGTLPACDVWTIKYADGFYTITQKGSNEALAVGSASVQRGDNVLAWNNYGGSEQKWAITYADGRGYRLQCKCSGFYLDFAYGSLETGTNVLQWSYNGSGPQNWVFIPYEPEQPVEEGRYVLVSTVNETYEVDVSGDTGDVSDGVNVQLWNDGCPSQYNSFDVIKQDNGYYKLKHAASGKYLSVIGEAAYCGTTDNYANIALWAEDGTADQDWAIVSSGSGYMLVSRCSGLVLDLDSGITEDGTNIRQHYYNGSNAQTWKFVQAEYQITYDANGGAGQPNSRWDNHHKAGA